MDTTPEVERLQLEKLRNMSEENRFLLTFEISESVRAIALDRIQSEHPAWGRTEIVHEYFREQFPDVWARLK